MGQFSGWQICSKIENHFLQFPSFILSVLLLANTSQHIFLVDLSCVDV